MAVEIMKSLPIPLSVADSIALVHEELSRKGKVRKGNGTPYVCHLGSVAQMVASYGGLEDTQRAAIFHDCVEDLGWSPEQIELFTNAKVMGMVAKLTEDKNLSWIERKALTCRTAMTCCQGVGIVLICDKLDSLYAINRECPREPRGFDAYWQRFNAGWKDQHWFYSALRVSLRFNRRLTAAPLEYPELRTDQALEEYTRALDYLDRTIDTFGRGQNGGQRGE